jgi:DNA-3-methyladenine glycosylase I
MKNLITRCAWTTTDPLYINYHDNEWGVPIYDDKRLFEFLILEGAQAGLSWITILRKREHYRLAFDQFNPEKIACYKQEKITDLMNNANIIRNRLKIESTITNAQAFLKLTEEVSFSDYLWQFVGNKPIKNHWKNCEQIPASTMLSDKLAKNLKQRGFKFVGSTICYAFMQAVGMVNDHVLGCFKNEKDK